MGRYEEICDVCGEPTGNAGRGDDSVYIELTTDYFGYKEGEELGPLCGECYDAFDRLDLAAV